MTKSEVIQEIISTPKWYVGKIKQQTASAIIKRFKSGALSEGKIKWLFAMYGYELLSEEQWGDSK